MYIATALNKKYVPYTGVMLYSLGINNPEEDITVFLLHSELETEDIDILQECINDLSITVEPFKVDSTLFDDRLPRTEQWSLETYYRLLLLDILPDTVDRLLYLDVDVIVNKSLSVLYHAEFDGAHIIACADMCGYPYKRYLDKKQQVMFKPLLDAGYQYFNAGVMLFNITELKKHYNFDFYAKVMAEDWKFEMSAPDQDILNYVHATSVVYADWAEFNLFARLAHEESITYDEVKAQVSIIHYPGGKPWETKDYHYDIERIWWDYAKKTNLYPRLLEIFMKNSIDDDIVERKMAYAKMQNKKLIEMNKKLLGKK